MTKPQIKIVNVTTGEEIIRDATAEEIAQMEKDAVNAAAKKANELAQANAKAELLGKLGITAEEAVLLLS
jgi:hypothetical protein